MHIYFSGIGGTAISSLALIAKEAGYQVSGSDARPSGYLKYLADHGITDTHIGVDDEFISKVHASKPIDWYVYGSAQPMDFPDHPEFEFCNKHGIKISKRDELLNQIINDKDLKLIAVAGTHGKSTTTAMIVWLFKQLGIPVSYSGGAKISFGDVSQFDPESEYFVYEADEYDRNFLNFYPYIGTVTGLAWDHPDIYPTQESYDQAFIEFLDQCEQSVIWHEDAEKLGLDQADDRIIMDSHAPAIENDITLAGWVNRANAWQAVQIIMKVCDAPEGQLVELINKFPGLSRRFEQIATNIYSDYAHTPEKIRGALQLANEVAGNNVVVVYEGLHNTRQHFIRDELATLFEGVKQLYIVPSFLAREDESLELLTPEKLLKLLTIQTRNKAAAAELNHDLKKFISYHAKQGDLVLCLSAGGAGSLDEWLRKEFAN